MSIRKTKPMCGQILVQSESTGLKSDLIVIPDNAAQSPPNRGVIVSAGSDCNEVAVGDKVKTGQPIGRAGNTGNTSEPHLHIHVEKGGNEIPILKGEGIPIIFDGRFLVRNSLVFSGN